jgi:hypothetical protein
MKTFTYTARDANGLTVRGSLMADNRADALLAIKKKNLVALSVVQGVTSPQSSLFSFNKLAWKSWLAGVVAVLLIVATVYFFMKGFGVRAPSGKNKATVSNKAASPKKGAITQKSAKVKQTEIEKAKKSAPTKIAKNPQPLKSPSLAESVPESPQPPAEPPVERDFKSYSEQLVAMLGLPGEEVPPLPDISGEDLEEDFAKGATNVIVIKEQDTTKVAALKENVAWVKTYIGDARQMGWTTSQYIQELEKTRRIEAEQRNAAATVLAEVESQAPEDSAVAKEVLNNELTTKGLIPLDAFDNE